MLRELFRKQAELNKRTGFDPDALRADFDPQTAGIWLNNYIAAMSNELEELRDCSFWKHWCKEAKEGKRYMLNDLPAKCKSRSHRYAVLLDEPGPMRWSGRRRCRQVIRAKAKS